MANTYVELKKETVVGTSTTSVTLTGFSDTYTDLRLVIQSQNQNNTNQPYIQFNADTGTGTTNYSTTSLAGNGTNGTSARHTSNIGWYPVPGPGVGTTGNFQPWAVDIMNYSNTTTWKSGLSRFNNASSILSANVHLWRSTAAINSITITAEAGAGYIVPGSTFSLYGIKAEPVVTAARATGGTISFASDGYTYHAFTSSGTFTPSTALTCDVLAVAGGGGGGGNHGGGGGAGGVLYTSTSSFSATGYSVTVGAAGTGANSTAPSPSTNGTNSSVNSLVAIGGGRGGCFSNNIQGNNGGSGGGAYTSAGLGTAGQGNNGGEENPNYALTGGGGGGAGAVGESPITAKAGAGGIGTALYSDFGNATSTGQSSSGLRYFGGGGAGGGWNGAIAVGLIDAGGLGGGGNSGAVTGSGASNGQAGTSNTGGGGGCGGGGSSNGGNGGSGVVIVRYLS
jgi:hypothetical protein